ncbi:unnamed protein product, partial [Ectocarpus fasciculatus]
PLSKRRLQRLSKRRLQRLPPFSAPATASFPRKQSIYSVVHTRGGTNLYFNGWSQRKQHIHTVRLRVSAQGVLCRESRETRPRKDLDDMIPKPPFSAVVAPKL